MHTVQTKQSHHHVVLLHIIKLFLQVFFLEPELCPLVACLPCLIQSHIQNIISYHGFNFNFILLQLRKQLNGGFSGSTAKIDNTQRFINFLIVFSNELRPSLDRLHVQTFLQTVVTSVVVTAFPLVSVNLTYMPSTCSPFSTTRSLF